MKRNYNKYNYKTILKQVQIQDESISFQKTYYTLIIIPIQIICNQNKNYEK
jgi:hypothetical protein